MAKRRIVENNIVIEGGRIGFRNFAGKEGQFNPAGERNFCVFLSTEQAQGLEEDGWNIRWLKPRDDQEDPQGYLPVKVSFEKIPPKIVLMTGRGKTNLDEDDVNVLDWAEIKDIDMIIRPYNWVLHEGTKAQKQGVKAYLKSMYVTIAEDEFEKKYYSVPEQGTTTPDPF